MRALNIMIFEIKNFLDFKFKTFDSLIGEIQR
jgi:hypothetical protein